MTPYLLNEPGGGEDVIWFWIGNHDEHDRRLSYSGLSTPAQQLDGADSSKQLPVILGPLGSASPKQIAWLIRVFSFNSVWVV